MCCVCRLVWGYGIQGIIYIIISPAYLYYPGVDTQDCDDDDDFDVDAYYYHDGDPADDLDLHPTCSSAAFRWTTPSDSAPLGAPRGL